MPLDNDKKIGFILGVLATLGFYTYLNLRQQAKLARRMKRNAAFLAESEVLKSKYPNGGDDEGKTMAAEIIALMDKYGL